MSGVRTSANSTRLCPRSPRRLRESRGRPPGQSFERSRPRGHEALWLPFAELGVERISGRAKPRATDRWPLESRRAGPGPKWHVRPGRARRRSRSRRHRRGGAVVAGPLNPAREPGARHLAGPGRRVRPPRQARCASCRRLLRALRIVPPPPARVADPVMCGPVVSSRANHACTGQRVPVECSRGCRPAEFLVEVVWDARSASSFLARTRCLATAWLAPDRNKRPASGSAGSGARSQRSTAQPRSGYTASNVTRYVSTRRRAVLDSPTARSRLDRPAAGQPRSAAMRGASRVFRS